MKTARSIRLSGSLCGYWSNKRIYWQRSITPEQAIFLFHSVLPSFENEHRVTTKVLKAVPADKAGFKPDPNSMSAFDLAWDWGRPVARSVY